MIQINDRVKRAGDNRVLYVCAVYGDGHPETGKVGVRPYRMTRYEYRRRNEWPLAVDPAELTPYDAKATKAAKLKDAQTCQICARPIHAANGIIAHHGYERPQYGWQTDSCFGARCEPFEVSRDELLKHLYRLKAGARHRARLVRALREDPARPVPGEKDYRTGETPMIIPAHPSYERMRRIELHRRERDFRMIVDEYTRQWKRYHAWKPGAGWRTSK